MIKRLAPYELPIYDNMMFCVVDCDSVEEINRYLKSQKIATVFEGEPFASTYRSGILIKGDDLERKLTLVVIDSKNKYFNEGVIAHEAMHCVHNVFLSIGQDLTPNHESQAYLLEYFFNKINELVKKNVKKKK